MTQAPAELHFANVAARIRRAQVRKLSVGENAQQVLHVVWILSGSLSPVPEYGHSLVWLWGFGRDAEPPRANDARHQVERQICDDQPVAGVSDDRFVIDVVAGQRGFDLFDQFRTLLFYKKQYLQILNLIAIENKQCRIHFF